MLELAHRGETHADKIILCAEDVFDLYGLRCEVEGGVELLCA